MAAGGVWVFRKDGVMELERQQQGSAASTGRSGGKALVYVPANETMRSLPALERRLGSLGWERYYEDLASVQLHRRDGGVDLINLPRDFARLRSTHMHDRMFLEAVVRQFERLEDAGDVFVSTFHELERKG